MISLLLSIICSSAIFLLFRKFKDWKVDTFSAIVVNYFVAGTFGLSIAFDNLSLHEVFYSSWIFNSLLLGIVFISLFYIMAKTSQEMGPSVASIANKMALIIPVVAAIWLYNDSFGFLKILGVFLALIGIFLSSAKESKSNRAKLSLWVLPLILFIGSGFIDTFLKYTEEFYLVEGSSDVELFPAFTFLTAFSIGVFVLIIKRNRAVFQGKNFTSGLVLGVINYGSIYFLIKAFSESNWPSSTLFPINNIGVVILTTFISYQFFKEHFSSKNKIGVLISIVALILIMLSNGI